MKPNKTILFLTTLVFASCIWQAAGRKQAAEYYHKKAMTSEKVEDVVLSLQQAISYDPQASAIRVTAAMVATKTGRVQQTHEHQQYILSHPDGDFVTWGMWFNLAQARLQTGNMYGAYLAAKQAAYYYPEFAEAKNFARFLENLKRQGVNVLPQWR